MGPHAAKQVQPDPVLLGRFAEAFQEPIAIFIVLEDRTAFHAPHRDVVDNTLILHADFSGHEDARIGWVDLPNQPQYQFSRVSPNGPT
jgi:hypothetical protein